MRKGRTLGINPSGFSSGRTNGPGRGSKANPAPRTGPCWAWEKKGQINRRKKEGDRGQGIVSGGGGFSGVGSSKKRRLNRSALGGMGGVNLEEKAKILKRGDHRESTKGGVPPGLRRKRAQEAGWQGGKTLKSDSTKEGREYRGSDLKVHSWTLRHPQYHLPSRNGLEALLPCVFRGALLNLKEKGGTR